MSVLGLISPFERALRCRWASPSQPPDCGKSLTDMFRDGASRGCCVWPGFTQQALASLWCWIGNIFLWGEGWVGCPNSPTSLHLPVTIAWALLAPSAFPEMLSFPSYKPDAWKHLFTPRIITTTISISISFCS